MILDAFRLTGKNALITGSSKGIGAAVAAALAEAGANIVLHSRSPLADEMIDRVSKTGVKAISLLGDLADAETCRQLVDRTVAEFGAIDILVNNAGIIRRSPAADYSAQDWQDVLSVNLNSVFRLSQVAGRHMLERGSGKIINMAKGAVAQLTKALANEWASKGICVNAIAPGYIGTDNTAALRADERRNRQILEAHPRGAMGSSAGPLRSRSFPGLSGERLCQWPCPGCGRRLARALMCARSSRRERAAASVTRRRDRGVSRVHRAEMLRPDFWRGPD